MKSMLPAKAAQLNHEARLKRDIAGWRLADHKEKVPALYSRKSGTSPKEEYRQLERIAYDARAKLRADTAILEHHNTGHRGFEQCGPT
jgi:hypothetical protein